MKEKILKGLSVIISLYFAYVVFIISSIFVNDFIVNSYNMYEKGKIQLNKVQSNVENYLQKGKFFVQKVIDKEKALETEKTYIKELKEKQKLEEEKIKKIQNNIFILSLFPYLLAIIIFMISYVKVFKTSEKFLENI